MYRFSRRSKAKLQQVDHHLQDLMNEVIKHIDISITSGIRTTQEQQDLFAASRSTLDGVHKKSKHQTGRAVDFCAYGNSVSFDGNDNAFIAGFIQATAIQMGINIRCGARWDHKLCSETRLFDPYHIELE